MHEEERKGWGGDLAWFFSPSPNYRQLAKSLGNIPQWSSYAELSRGKGMKLMQRPKVMTSKADLTLHTVGVQIFEDRCLLFSCSRRNRMEQTFRDGQQRPRGHRKMKNGLCY